MHRGRRLSLSIVIAAISDMTILSAVNCEISPRTCFASPALTAIRMRSAFLAASRLSVVTAIFPERERGKVETFLAEMAHAAIRSVCPTMEKDRVMYADFARIAALIANGKVAEALR